jgi:hypothetical protein
VETNRICLEASVHDPVQQRQAPPSLGWVGTGTVHRHQWEPCVRLCAHRIRHRSITTLEAG